jgi:CheY-like chemotaxis protein
MKMSHLSPALLVVDDDDTNRSLLARLFEAKGFTVATASSGAEALEHVCAGGTDLVLLDMNMPGMTGFDVLNRFGPRTRPARCRW